MEYSFLFLADMLACLLLALAASCRSMVYGATHTGALVLGMLAGCASPAMRDVLLGLGTVAPLHNASYAAITLAGALLGILTARHQAVLGFRWAEALSLGLATALGASHGLALGLGPVGCILLGVTTGTVGGLLRDVCLGDTPQALERQFYVTASAIGAMVVIGLWHFQVGRLGQELLATIVVTALRLLGHKQERA